MLPRVVPDSFVMIRPAPKQRLSPDLISFSVPTSEQLRSAASVLRDHGSLLPDELWTTDFADLPGASAVYMPLQPVLRH